MRCKYCGSNVIHPATNHRTFSKGKAVAGAVAIGAVGAAAGLIGKDIKGYECGMCGAFMEAPMEKLTEISVNDAIREAESGRSRSMFDYFKREYPNIQANIPVSTPAAAPAAALPEAETVKPAKTRSSAKKSSKTSKKSSERVIPCEYWQPDSPIFVKQIRIEKSQAGDSLALDAVNQSGKTIRSAYFQAIVYDDTNDEIERCSLIYQDLKVKGDGAVLKSRKLPAATKFKLNTNLAYRADIVLEKVAFADDSVWRAEQTSKGYRLPEQKELTSQNFPNFKYVETCAARQRKPLFLPVEMEDFWMCDCGHPARKDQACSFCGDTLTEILPALSQSVLEARKKDAVKDRAAKRAAQTQNLCSKAREEYIRIQLQKAKKEQMIDTIPALERAVEICRELENDHEAQQLRMACEARIEEIRKADAEAEQRKAMQAEEEKRHAAETAAAAKKKRSKLIAVVCAAAAVILAAALIVTQVIIPKRNYSEAESLEQTGDIPGAAMAYGTLAGRDKDCREKSFAYWETLAPRSTIAAGSWHAVGLKSDGTVVTSGDNAFGQCDVTGWADIVAVAAGERITIGLKSDGSVVAAGTFETGDCDVSGWKNIVAIAVSKSNAFGLKADGTVVATGDNQSGQRNVSGWKGIVAIAAGSDHVVGLKADGTVVAAGFNGYGQCKVSEWSDIIAIAAGDSHTAGLKTDGTVVATGKNDEDQCNVSGWKDITAIAAGGDHTVGLEAKHSIIYTGDSGTIMLSAFNWENIVAIDTSDTSVVFLKSDGTAEVNGYIALNESSVSDWEEIRLPGRK